MAALNSPELQTQSQAARRSTVPAAPKLRDSCHACAASKVRCDKQKPNCARCIKRGLACEYFLTKRVGRKNENRSRETTNVTQVLTGDGSSSSSDTRIFTTPNLNQPTARQYTPNYPDVFPDLLQSVDQPWSPMLTAASTDFDDFASSPISLPGPETFNFESLTQSQTGFTGIDDVFTDSTSAADFSIPKDAFSVLNKSTSDPPAISRPLSPPNSRLCSNSDAYRLRGCHSSESPASCLMRALDLLQKLFPTDLTNCTQLRKQDCDDTPRQLPTIQSIITENERTLEAITNMLQCPCSQDAYLLTIMSLVVFKVLGWYAAAARKEPVTADTQNITRSDFNHRKDQSCHSERVSPFPAVVGSYCIGGEDQGRMAAQLVLSELHRVQRLVKGLSQRLKDHGGHQSVAIGIPNSVADSQATGSDKHGASPFSITMLDQLEADLRKRLRTLSIEIVDMLRRE